MAEYMFGVGSKHLPKKAAKIAEKHGAELINYTDPGCSCGHGCGGNDCPANRRHWFTAENRGYPFDRDLSTAVLADLRAADIIPPE